MGRYRLTSGLPIVIHAPKDVRFYFCIPWTYLDAVSLDSEFRVEANSPHQKLFLRYSWLFQLYGREVCRATVAFVHFPIVLSCKSQSDAARPDK